MKDNEEEKYFYYAGMISGAITEMFKEDSEWYIDQEELAEGDNLTHFMHAIANLTPTHIYNSITGENKNLLQFNHIANQLCFQYTNKIS